MVNTKKRLLTLLLAISLCITLLPADGYAMAASTSSQEISSFIALPEKEKVITIYDENRPDLAELISYMPDTLECYFAGDLDSSEIPVSWECVGDDYEASNSYYFQFSPIIESTYNFSSSADLPYISVFVLADDNDNNGASDAVVHLLGANLDTSIVKSENAVAIYNFLITNMNYNSAAACGVLANIYSESGFKADIIEKGYTWETGGGYGICQWTNAPRTSATGRRSNLVNYCVGNGYDYTTLDGQLRYLQYELSANNKTILWNGKTINDKMLSFENSPQGAYDAGYYWCYTFEVPADKETRAVTRGNLAKDSFWANYGTMNAFNIPGGIHVDWTGLFNASYYNLYRGLEATGLTALAYQTADTSFIDTAVVTGGAYNYTVYAYLKPQNPTETPEQLAAVPATNELVSTFAIERVAPEYKDAYSKVNAKITGIAAPGNEITANISDITVAATDKIVFEWYRNNKLITPPSTSKEEETTTSKDETTSTENNSAKEETTAKDSTTTKDATGNTATNTEAALPPSTSSKYTLQKEDIGQEISCTIAISDEKASIPKLIITTKVTPQIKETNTLAPVADTINPTSAKGAADGSIVLANPNNMAIEYSNSVAFHPSNIKTISSPDADGKWRISGLSTGNYYIRYKETDTKTASTIAIYQIADKQGSATVDLFFYLAPTTLNVSNVTSGSTLNWLAVPGASAYQVYKATNDGEFELLDTVAALTYTDLSATNNASKYQYKVLAIFTDSNNKIYASADSNIATTFHLVQPKIRSIVNDNGSLLLTWKPVANATSYSIYRKKSTKKVYGKIGVTTETSFVDPKSYKNGTTYDYKIVANYTDNVGGLASSAPSAQKSYIYLSKPKITELSCLHSKSLSVFYSKNKKASGYQIQRSLYKDFHSKKTLKVTSPNTGAWRITNLKKGKKYYVRVRSYKIVNGTKYFSGWSTIKKKKVTK